MPEFQTTHVLIGIEEEAECGGYTRRLEKVDGDEFGVPQNVLVWEYYNTETGERYENLEAARLDNPTDT